MNDSAEFDSKPDRTPTETGPTLQDFLAHREEACPSCGYNLRGLTGNTCPECGSALVLRVGLAQPISIAWVVSLVSSGMGFAGAGTFLSLAIVVAPPGWIFETVSGWMMSILTPVCSVLLIALATLRRRFNRWPKRRQRLIAGVMAVGVLVTLFLIVVLFEN